MTTTADPRLPDCVVGGYSVVLANPRPGLGPPVLPDRLISRSRCLVEEFADAWLDTYRAREGDMDAVDSEARERFGLDREAVGLDREAAEKLGSRPTATASSRPSRTPPAC